MNKKIIRAAVAGIAAVGMAVTVQGVPATAATAQAARSASVAAAGCPGSHDAGAGYTGWSYSTSPCAWITAQSVKNAQHRRYTWWTPDGSNAAICVQAQGHTWSPSKHKNVSRWYSAGCGKGGSVLVPWHAQPDNKKGGYYGIAAKPRVRAKVEPFTLGNAFSWS